MYCPSCGMQTSPDLKYCRSCGMALQTISDAVAQHTGQALEKSESRRKRLERWGTFTGMVGVGAIMLLIVGALLCVALLEGAIGGGSPAGLADR